MRNQINQNFWLNEQDIPPMGGQPDMVAGGPPMTQPGGPADPMNQMSPNQMTMDTQSGEDISEDPQYPEMPETEEDDDFEIWKIKYVKETIKGDPNKLIDRILKIRDRELDPVQRKFVEDNLDINFLRRNANIFQASTEVRKRLKNEFDQTHPATSVVGHITSTLDEMPLLNEIFIKLNGLGGGKMDQHRKFISALLGAVQVGGGSQNEDLVFEETDWSIRISTRFNAKWGDVNIGRWYLKEDDPERFLKDAELDRLEGGSPEEKDVLRRRIVIESIAEQYRERSFVINVVGHDGTIYHLGWDLGNSLKSAFLDGKLVVRTNDNDNKEAFIDEEGSIITIPHLGIYYIKESGDLDQKGKLGLEEIEFMTHRDGMLFLSAPLDLIKEASISLQGMLFKETLWQGNPSDLLRISRCCPNSSEILLRDCG